MRGTNYRASTKETILHEAIHFAEEWYFELRGKANAGTLEIPAKKEITFREVADQFIKEYSVITKGQRSPLWVEGHAGRLRVHLLPFFGDLPISKVTGGKVQEYRVHRMTPLTEKNPNSKDNRPFKEGAIPAPKTLHNEIVTLNQVLKTAVRHGWLTSIPDVSKPYKLSGKVSHRPWFSPKEYKQLYEATRKMQKMLCRNSDGRQNNYTTMYCSWAIQACALMKQKIFNIAILRLSKMLPRGNAFS